MFFSKVEVLRARQNNHPTMCTNMWLLIVIVRVQVRVPLLLLSLYAQNAYFCVSMYIRFASLFFGIHSKASFHMDFYQCFSMQPLAASLVAPQGLVVGLRQSSDSARTMLVLLKFY